MARLVDLVKHFGNIKPPLILDCIHRLIQIIVVVTTSPVLPLVVSPEAVRMFPPQPEARVVAGMEDTQADHRRVHVIEPQPLLDLGPALERLIRKVGHHMHLELARAGDEHAAQADEPVAVGICEALLDSLREVEFARPASHLDVQQRPCLAVAAKQVAHERAARRGADLLAQGAALLQHLGIAGAVPQLPVGGRPERNVWHELYVAPEVEERPGARPDQNATLHIHELRDAEQVIPLV